MEVTPLGRGFAVLHWLCEVVAAGGAGFLRQHLCGQWAHEARLAGPGLGQTHAHTVSDKKSFLFALLRRLCFFHQEMFPCAVELSKWGHTTALLKESHSSVVISYGTETRLVEFVEGNNLFPLLLPYPLLSRNSEWRSDFYLPAWKPYPLLV